MKIRIRVGQAVIYFSLNLDFGIFDASEHDASKAVFERQKELSLKTANPAPAYRLGRDSKGRFVKIALEK